MSDEVRWALLFVALLLPPTISYIFDSIREEMKHARALPKLCVKISAALLWVASVGFLVGMGVYGTNHFNDKAGDFVIFWVVAFFVVLFSAISMAEG